MSLHVVPLAIQVAWLKRDLLLYAVGIGAKKDDHTLINGAQHLLTLYCIITQLTGVR